MGRRSEVKAALAHGRIPFRERKGFSLVHTMIVSISVSRKLKNESNPEERAFK
jgi:hypothetical protein